METNGRTDGRTDGADCVTRVANAVGNKQNVCSPGFARKLAYSCWILCISAVYEILVRVAEQEERTEVECKRRQRVLGFALLESTHDAVVPRQMSPARVMVLVA